MAPKRPTIDDVARLSGVARTTVSRVLNGGPNVRDEVRARVLEAVEELNYRVNPQARSLAGGGSRTLAMIFASDLEAEPNSFYAAALELGALRECLASGYQLIARHVAEQGPDRHRQVLDLVVDQHCEGLILTPPYADDVTLIREAQRLGCHVAAISPGGAGRTAADGVGIDEEAGGYDIGRQLIELGHRRFGFISGIAGHLAAEQRFDGFQRALAGHGVDPAEIQLARGDFTFRSGRENAEILLDGPHPPTALVCANDDMAAGVLSVAHSRGMEVPGDVSITGFDDTPVSAIVWPPLTTVHQPLKSMGREAVRALSGRITGAVTQEEWRFQTLEHVVVPRASAGAVRIRPVAAAG